MLTDQHNLIGIIGNYIIVTLSQLQFGFWPQDEHAIIVAGSQPEPAEETRLA